MAKDTLALINHLQWNRCHVVGISMGGMIGLELALLAPEKIISLTLLATHAGGLIGRTPFIGLRHMIRGLLLRDEHLFIENLMEMEYGTIIHANPDKRKVRKQKKQTFYDYFSFRLFMIIILKNVVDVYHHHLLVLLDKYLLFLDIILVMLIYLKFVIHHFNV
jgi:pimeloyl-ACP methyl ester carboxylesterase